MGLYNDILLFKEKYQKNLLKTIANESLKKYSKDLIYSEPIDKNHFVYFNILSSIGFTVLDSKVHKIYALIDNQKTPKDIYNILLHEDKNLTFKKVINIVDKLRQRQLLWINEPISFGKSKYENSKKITVWFHITNNCNLRCNYCFVHKSSEKMDETLIYKSINKIFKSAKKKNVKTIALGIAGGEPLLVFNNVEKLLKYAYEKANIYNIQFLPGIATNGTLITEKVAKTLKKYNVFVKLSLDGLGKYNDINRHFANGKGSFKFVQKGLKNIIKYKLDWATNTVITEKSVVGLPKFAEWLLKKKIYFNFSFFRDNPASPKKQNLINNKFISYLKNTYKIIEEKIPSYRLTEFLLDRVTFEGPHKRCCGIGSNYLAINHKGKILSCPLFDEKIIGDITKDDPIDTMINKCIINKKVNVGNVKKCQTCIWRFSCAGGCPLLTYYNYGKYNVPTPVCKLIKSLAPTIVRIEGKRLLKYNLSQQLILFNNFN